MYLNKEVCARCGGVCCKSYPGSVFPSDLEGVDEETIAGLLVSGYCIDWWEGDVYGKERGRSCFIRPRAKGDERVFSPLWHGECVFHSESGCDLTFSGRPHECRMIEPVDGGG